MIALAVVVTVPPQHARASSEVAPVEVTRHGGADRYATSLLVAEEIAELEGGSLEWVVIVPGRSWTDAVVAVPLAGRLGAPVLVTPSAELRDDAAEFLSRTGVSKALLIGADSDADGVGPTVVARLRALGIGVERVTGRDQFETSVNAARKLGAPGKTLLGGPTVILANGEVFADALVAGPMAARGGHPVLLTQPDELHPLVAGYIADTHVDTVVIMGGTAAISEKVAAAVADSASSTNVVRHHRIAGADRFETASKLAQYVEGRYERDSRNECFTDERFGLARARVPVDAFSAGPLLARLCAPLLLTEPGRIPRQVAAHLDAARADAAFADRPAVQLWIFGGSAAVSPNALDAYRGRVRPVRRGSRGWRWRWRWRWRRWRACRSRGAGSDLGRRRASVVGRRSQ